VPIAQVSSNIGFVAQFGAALFGSAGARVLSACVLVCVFGGLAALTMAAPRVAYAMAQSGAFFPVFGRLHPRFGTPAWAILLQTALSLAVLAFGAFDRVLSYIIFSAVLFLALAVSTLLRTPDKVAAWWFPWAPLVFIGFCGLIGLLILMHDPVPALIGIGIVLLGLPLRRLVASQPVQSPLIAEGSEP
jgi:APA family basic amino acid/polyamine antiporter